MRPSVTVGFLLISASVFANDGGISFGGSPRLLDGHPSVSMASEVIHMKIGDRVVTVDCTFVFRNKGKACTVRMGFPDWGLGASDPYEERQTDWAKTKLVSVYRSFKSTVDGRPTKTELIRGAENHAWRAKVVQFAANQTRVVHDVYTMDVGGGIMGGSGSEGSVKEASYILHTGASWHGPIGKSEVFVHFPSPIQATRNQAWNRGKAWPKGSNAVVYSGPGNATVQGSTLRFVRTNWRPTAKDDVDVFWGYRGFGRN